MSDIKPKRAAREPAQGEAAFNEALAAATAPIVKPGTVPDPAAVSPAALARAIPAPAEVPAAPSPEVPLPEAVEFALPVAANAASAAPRSTGADRAEAVAENAWTAFAEAQAALARGFERAALEMTGMSRSGVAATADAAVALLGARTFAEALEINAGLARRGVDTMLQGSARLSEIGVKTVADASRPMLARFRGGWSGTLPG